MGVAQSSSCCCLNSEDCNIPRKVLEAELYLPLCPHIPTMANSSGSSLQGPVVTTVPLQPLKAFAPKNLQVTALIEVPAIDSICNQSKCPQLSLGFPNISDTREMPLKLNLHTDAFSRTCLHSPHVHRSEA